MSKNHCENLPPDFPAAKRGLSDALRVFRRGWMLLVWPLPLLALDPAKSVFQFNAQNWTRQTGLSSDKISAVAQTRDGYVWLGTQNGLVRFDGVEFKTVAVDLPQAQGDEVAQISPAGAGGLWFAIGGGGFGRYDGRKFSAIGDDRWTRRGLNAITILEARDGSVWTGGIDGLGRWVKGQPEKSFFDESTGTVVSLHEDATGRVWIGTGEHGLFYWADGKLVQIHDDVLLKRNIFAVATEADGQIWVGTGHGLRRYDASGQFMESFFADTQVNTLLVDRHGLLWAGTNTRGLARYQHGQFTFLKKADGLGSDYVRALCEDAEGSLWVGTQDGLSQLSDLKFPIYTSQEGIAEGGAQTVATSRRGGIWIAAATGASYFDGRTATNYTSTALLPNLYVLRCFEARNGDVYLGDGDKNINVLTDGHLSARYPCQAWPEAFAEDATSVLVGVGPTLCRVRGDKLEPFEFADGQQPPFDWINNLWVARDDAIWAATNHGIFRIKDRAFKQWSTVDGLSADRIHFVFEDVDGAIWAGLPTGLVRIKDDLISSISEANGLFDRRIFAIVPDQRGFFWINSGRGLFRVARQALNDCADGKSPTVRCEDFTGLASVKSMDRTNQGFSGCRTPDGRIWFPNPRGVVMIDPENFFVNPVPPPVRIQQIRVNGAGRNERQSAILKAGDGRVEFLFAALSFISPKSVQVRYQLEGFDPTWVDAGPRRSVLYNNLKPGRYTFRVQASNADGVWNTTGESFGLELPPSFYQTTWFYVLCGVAGVLILLVAYRWKVRRMELSQRKLQAENNLLESKVAQRTDELAHSLSVLKATIDSTADGILAIDFSDALVCHNTQFAAMWGIPPEVLAQGGNGRVIAFSATQVREPEKYLARIAELKASPVAESFDVIEMKDGRIFERYCRPQRMDGRSVGVVINFRDVTERKRAAAGLEEASGLLDAMLENIPDFIYFKDRASRFVRFSRSFLNRFKLADAAALRGRTDFDLFTAEHAQPAYDDEQAIIRTGNALVGQLEKETYSDGTATWVLTTKMPWRDGHGTVVGTFGISKDVTELKVTEAKLAYERDLLHILFRDLPDSIYFKDLQSRFVRLSQSKVEKALAFLRAAHRARHPAEAADQWPPHLAGVEQLAAWLHGKTDFDLMPEKLARVCYDEEQEIIRTGRPVLRRIENTTLPDGTTAWQVITKMPWRDATGKIIGTYGTAHDITAIKEAEAKLADTHRRLLEISREAGMAEVATGVLHNVGNVLNSVNVSTTLLFDHVRQSKIGGLAKLGELLRAHESDLPGFFGQDPRGRQVPGYLDTLSTHLAAEQAEMLKELASLRNNIEHIKDIVSMQQNYAKVRGVMESVAVTALVEDALHMNASALARHDVTLVRDYLADPVITVEKHKVLQILVNLMRNAKYACDDSGRSDKQMTVRVSADDGRVQIAVIDNGIGIPPENMARIFSHGFTTRQLGHGFGLHTGALAARELGGSLTVQSDGPGRGATFILEIPEQPDAKAA